MKKKTRFWIDQKFCKNALDVIGLLLVLPILVQLVNFARNVPLVLQVKSLEKMTNLQIYNWFQHNFIIHSCV